MRRYVAVCGASDASPEEDRTAEAIGRLLAERGAIVVCGGLTGVMDAAARGAAAAGGLVVGLLPGTDREGGSEHLTVALPLGMGEARNAYVVRVADAVIAIGGEWGTLSEVALGMKMGKRVIAVDSWRLDAEARGLAAPILASSPDEAVDVALGR